MQCKCNVIACNNAMRIVVHEIKIWETNVYMYFLILFNFSTCCVKEFIYNLSQKLEKINFYIFIYEIVN